MCALNECKRGDKIRIFGCVGYFGGITMSEKHFVLHVTDVSGFIRRFKIGASDRAKQVDLLTPSINTLIERVDLFNKFKTSWPTLAYWLF